MKKGLILEGGAMRGLYTAGIMDVMMENGITFDGIVGVSAGAAFGCNYKSHQPGRVIRYNKRFANEWRYCSVRSWLLTGNLYGADFCYHKLPTELDVFDMKTYEADPTEFYAVCTDVLTGEAVYKKIMDCNTENFEWFRASASMPIASRVVKIGDRRLLDGGISDSIPLKFFQEKGYNKNVVILTQPEGYIKKPSSMMPLMRMQLWRYPRFLRAAAERHIMYNEQLAYVAEQEKQGNALVFRPKTTIPINHITHNTSLMQQVYDMGREDGIERLEEVRQFLIGFEI